MIWYNLIEFVSQLNFLRKLAKGLHISVYGSYDANVRQLGNKPYLTLSNNATRSDSKPTSTKGYKSDYIVSYSCVE